MRGTRVKVSRRRYLLLAISLLLFGGTVIAHEPADAARYVKLGISRYARGDFDHAIRYFDLALASDPHLASAYLNRGKARQAKGDLDDAIADYDRAMEIDSTVAERNTEKLYGQRIISPFEGILPDLT